MKGSVNKSEHSLEAAGRAALGVPAPQLGTPGQRSKLGPPPPRPARLGGQDSQTRKLPEQETIVSVLRNSALWPYSRDTGEHQEKRISKYLKTCIELTVCWDTSHTHTRTCAHPHTDTQTHTRAPFNASYNLTALNI